ncbi:MAG: lipoyl synthase [Deltaproteobacteria bacterium]|nr:lipoyl synthase [Deltaproteobacteria bacterium]
MASSPTRRRADSSRKPAWLKRSLPAGPAYEAVRRMTRLSGVNTVCREARCPNIWECFGRRTATFLLMGPSCSRHCRFCAVKKGSLQPLDSDEPRRVAETVQRMGLRHAVITSVTRDDLPDGGARHIAETILRIRELLSETTVEILIPDFRGEPEAIQTVVAAKPHVIGHNMETVRRLFPMVRPEGNYDLSLTVLKTIKKEMPGIIAKSGFMLGLGEKKEEVEEMLLDLRHCNCDVVTIGQYLQPDRCNAPVHRFVDPEEFNDWERLASVMGFRNSVCGPLVRSSYRAEEMYENISSIIT